MTKPDEIAAAFETEGDLVSKSRVLEWMADRDLAVQGATYWAITDRSRSDRIQPNLTLNDYYEFVVPYLERCMIEDPDDDWSESRYLAGHALQHWFRAWWDDKDVPRSYVEKLKNELERLYRAADAPLRDAIVNAILEHLFESNEIADYFSDWQKDPLLVEAFDSAREWSKPA